MTTVRGIALRHSELECVLAHRQLVLSAIHAPAIGPIAGPVRGARVYIEVASLFVGGISGSVEVGAKTFGLICSLNDTIYVPSLLR